VSCYLEIPEADRPEVRAALKERRNEAAFADGVRAVMREND
jgi:hypothetical protein